MRFIQTLLFAVAFCSMPAALGCESSEGEEGAAGTTEFGAGSTSPPPVPTVVQVGDAAALEVRWSGANAGFVAVDRRYPGCGGYCYEGNVFWSSDPVLTWTDTDVEYGIEYGYKVWNGAGKSEYSDGVAAVRTEDPSEAAGPPSVPTVVQVGDSKALKLTWSGGNSGFVAVDRRYPGCGSYCYEGNVFWSNDPVHEWIDTSVHYGVEYGYKVWNSDGDAGYSEGVAAVEGSGGTTPGIEPWKLVWSDEFDGPADASAATHWMTYPAWADGPRPGDHYWRDAVNSPSECYLDGGGNLVLRTRYVDGERRACYLATGGNGYDESTWTTFGPGDKGTYIEFRANVSQMRAHASWFAMWLMSPNDTYDGNPGTGSEIDVMEYIPFAGTQYSLMNLFHAAVWWGKDEATGFAEPPEGGPVDAWGQANASWFGADLSADGFHTWGIEWYDDKQIFTFDGQPYWTNDLGVSDAENHTIRLSIEIQNGNPYNLWGHPVGAFEDNDPAKLPSYALVDYVRVYTKK